MSRTLVAALVLATISTAHADSPKVRPPVAEDLAVYTKNISGKGVLTATIETSMGSIHCALFEKETPMTVAAFVGLATGQKPWTNPRTGDAVTGKHFYDGLRFHRVIPEFMIQGGDPLGTGTGGPGYKFANETSDAIKFKPGSLAMANAGADTNGSQFFITESAPDYLQGKHTIFGQCAELAIVKKIARAPQGNTKDRPDPDVVINKVSISRVAP
jgi:peptidyl-prolyl cis-trans isomerase A (cyclophilin A)